MKNRSVKLLSTFSFFCFIIVPFWVLTLGLLVLLLFRLGIINMENPTLLLITFGLLSALSGWVMSILLGRYIYNWINTINRATKGIADNDFSIRISEDIPVDEIREMAHNFNLMAQELACTEILRKEFIENVSHEFKTPLSAIEGYATLLQGTDLSEEKRQEYTERIITGTQTLSNMMSNILLLSGLENQGIEPKRERFSLDEQIRECILLLEPKWTAKKLELDIDLDECYIYANRELLSHVWQNLLANAIKFTPDGGMLGVKLHKSGDTICVEVSDSGIGMTKEVQARIFERFYQGDRSHTSHGNGLGLALVDRIVKMHGGTISVISEEGVGSTFKVTF